LIFFELFENSYHTTRSVGQTTKDEVTYFSIFEKRRGTKYQEDADDHTNTQVFENVFNYLKEKDNKY